VVSRHRAGSTWPAFQARGVCSPQPFREPEGPDHNERESEKCSAGQESHRARIHDILQEVDRSQFLFATNEHLRRSATSPRLITSNVFVSKICGDQIVRSPASADVNLRGCRAYHITVAIERVQETGLIGAGIWLNSLQCALVYEE
jgi:hypothetical protein